MAEAKINKGDVLRLKSGGPKMTVTNVGDGPLGSFVECAWFDQAGKKCEDTFPPEALEK